MHSNSKVLLNRVTLSSGCGQKVVKCPLLRISEEEQEKNDSEFKHETAAVCRSIIMSMYTVVPVG